MQAKWKQTSFGLFATAVAAAPRPAYLILDTITFRHILRLHVDLVVLTLQRTLQSFDFERHLAVFITNVIWRKPKIRFTELCVKHTSFWCRCWIFRITFNENSLIQTTFNVHCAPLNCSMRCVFYSLPLIYSINKLWFLRSCLLPSAD